MAVGWGTFRDDDAESAAPSTQYIFAAVGVDPANPDTVAVAYREVEPVPYARPDELQPGIIEPTALLRPTGRTLYEVEHDQTWSNYT